MNQLQRIEKALTALVLDQPFFAVLAMRLPIVMDNKKTPTFATDGQSLYINAEFCASLKDKEIITVLAHEVLHCALGHIWRKPEGADHETWNRAIDNEANWELQAANDKARHNSQAEPFPWPSCGKEMEDRFKGVAAEIVYRALSEEKPPSESGPGKKGQTGQGPSFGEVLPVPQDAKPQIKEVWDRAVMQAAKVAQEKGHIPGAIEEMIKRITSNKVDWRAVLRDYLSTAAHEDWSFRQPNSRYADSDFVLPSLNNERAGKIVFAIDTSGSINSELLSAFISEAQQCLDDLNPESLTVIYCDADIQAIDTYEPGDIIKEKVTGRGGTDFRPVFDHCNKLEEIPKVLVYLTDLEGDFPEEKPEYRTLWLSTSDRVNPPFGDVIEI